MHQTWGIELGLHLGISNFRCCNSLKQTFFPLNIALSSLPHNRINRTLHGKISAEKKVINVTFQ